MGEIKRIGPPTPINGRGSEYDLSVPLNATPSQLWRRAFQAPDDWKEPRSMALLQRLAMALRVPVTALLE
jgi:hypothetical protein